MTTSTKTCSIPNCGNELSEFAISPFCHNCRGHFSRWKKRRPAERLERSRKLRLYSARMDEMLDNVVDIKSRKKA